MAYCAREVPQWNTISVSGYHIREAGSTAVEEVAFTLANAKAYLRAARDAGIALDDVAPRISFFWNAHNDFFEEIAKFRAARYLWAHITRDEFGCRDPRSQMLRFHTQTGGSTLTAQEPENNVVRVTLQALAAVLGGTQSLHTNGKDEALALPTAESAKVALRTQQIIAYESGVADVVDPLAGSYYVETLTNELIERATAAHRGGRRAGRKHRRDRERLDAGAHRRVGLRARSRRSSAASSVVVGVNRFAEAPTPRDSDSAAAHRRARRARAGRAARGVSRDARRRSGRAASRRASRAAASEQRKPHAARSSTRSTPAQRSARSATCCAKSSARIDPRKSSRDIVEIDHVAIVVKDLEATLRLYTRDAGLQRDLSRGHLRSGRRGGRLGGGRIVRRAASSARRGFARSRAIAASGRRVCTTPPTASPTSRAKLAELKAKGVTTDRRASPQRRARKPDRISCIQRPPAACSSNSANRIVP